ncbi:MAG TPA: 23S rRNA (guanosine(2251)-2'-O)-methyltransferase RlmB [Candidatus Xenobia bacterium]
MEEGQLIYGRHAVLEALQQGRELEHVYLAPEAPPKLKVAAKEAGVPWSEAGKQELDRRAGGRPHQGVVAVVSAFHYAEVEDIWKRVDASPPALVLVVPQIFDPGNLGALLRSAEAAGVHGVVLGKRRTCGLTGVVGKAAAGALEHLPVARVVNAQYFLDEVKERGLWVVGADSTGDTEYTKAKFSEPTALVLGSETGLGPVLLKKCDVVVRIPMYGKVESLNVSVAGALLMFEARRQRRG